MNELIQAQGLTILSDFISNNENEVALRSGALKILALLCNNKANCLTLAQHPSLSFFLGLMNGKQKQEFGGTCALIVAHIMAALDKLQRAPFWDHVVATLVGLIREPGTVGDYALNNLVQIPWEKSAILPFTNKYLGKKKKEIKHIFLLFLQNLFF